MIGAEALVRTLVDAGVTPASPTRARPRCTSWRRSTPSRRCARCSRCSRAWRPGRPTATRAWPTSRRRRCCTSGPGLGNGVGQPAQRAQGRRVPIVNIVGDHATYHTQYDAQLQSDIETVARNVLRAGCGRRRAREALGQRRGRGDRRRAGPARPGRDADPARRRLLGRRRRARAAAAARRRPRRRRSDVESSDRAGAARPRRASRAAARRPRAARAGAARRRAASRAATGAKLLVRGVPDAARARRRPAGGRADRVLRRARASVQLAGLKHLILVDAKAPVSFFAYPGKTSYLVPDGCEVHELAGARATMRSAALEALVDALGAADAQPARCGGVAAGAADR